MKVTSNSGASKQVAVELEHVGSYVDSLLNDTNVLSMGGKTLGDGTTWEGQWLPTSLPEVKCDYSGEFSLKLMDADHFKGSWWCGKGRMHQRDATGNEYPPDGSITGTKIGTPTSQGQTGQTGMVTPGSCSCDKTKHLVWDGYEGCNCVCENGWKFDANGDCQPSIASQLGPTTGSQGILGSSIVLNTDQGDTSIKSGDKITLSPQQRADLKVKCDSFIELVKLNSPKGAWGYGFGALMYYYRLRNPSDEPEYSSHQIEWGNAFGQLSKCLWICAKLYGGGYGPLNKLSKTIDSSDLPVQIEFALEKGPMVFEVVNDQTYLGVETSAMKATSIGRNTFGVFHDPNSGESIIAAYQNPVDIQPKNNNLATFILGSGQVVGINMNGILPTMPISQVQGGSVPSGANNPAYVSPDGKDIYGQTGAALQPATSGVAQGGYPDITGIWYMGGPYNEGMSCQILHNGNALIFINERGDQSAGGFVDSGTVVASDWQGLQGRISDGGKRIDWSNGTWWARTKQEGNVQAQGTPTSGMDGGCHTDPATGNIICVDSFGNPGRGLNQGNSQVQSGGCYQDPLTGEITCVETSGNPTSSRSSQDNSQGQASGGCYQDPKTGKITCVDAAGTPEGLSAPEKGCYTDPSTGEVTCID